MLGFILGISLTLNVIGVIGLIIYFSVKNKVFNNFNNKFINSLDNEEIDNKEIANNFVNDDDIDFSSMFKR